MITIKQTTLYYRENSADKVYRVSIAKTPPDENNPSTFSTVIEYGRRGRPMRQHSAYVGDSLDQSKKIYEAKIHAKILKGYSEQEGVTASTVLATPFPTTNVLPQLANTVDKETLMNLWDHWDVSYFIGQTKHDGERRTVGVDKTGKVMAANRRGLGVPLTAEIENTLQELYSVLQFPFILDCEDMGDHLAIFDILEWRHTNIRNLPFEIRHDMLFTLWSTINAGLQPTLYPRLKPDTGMIILDSNDLTCFIDWNKENNEEGIILRHPSATYTTGRPNSGGNLLKYKFISSTTALVIEHNTGVRSVQVAVCGDKVSNGYEAIYMGNVTIPPNYSMPAVGELVEIEYLYAYPDGGKLYQPQYKGIRVDIDLPDTYKSLKFKQ